MPFTFHWSSSKGRGSANNQDYGGLAIGESYVVAVIVDGVSFRPGSGAVALELSRRVVDKAINSRETPTGEQTLGWLREIHRDVRLLRLASGAAAYLIACFDSNSLVFTIHAGDCRLGLVSACGSVEWQTPIHSLATAVAPIDETLLANAQGRNQLTRSFATRRFCEPEFETWQTEISRAVVLGTDGFWAATTPETQALACRPNGDVPHFSEDEDTSRLLACPSAAFTVHDPDGTPNLYVRDCSAP